MFKFFLAFCSFPHKFLVHLTIVFAHYYILFTLTINEIYMLTVLVTCVCE